MRRIVVARKWVNLADLEMHPAMFVHQIEHARLDAQRFGLARLRSRMDRQRLQIVRLDHPGMIGRLRVGPVEGGLIDEGRRAHRHEHAAADNSVPHHGFAFLGEQGL